MVRFTFTKDRLGFCVEDGTDRTRVDSGSPCVVPQVRELLAGTPGKGKKAWVGDLGWDLVTG